jgi:hypothetical protein
MEHPKPTRREFLRAGTLGAFALASGDALGSVASTDRSVIVLLLGGGPSQIDSFDPKPDAPAEIRGPFRSMETTVPGIRVSEHLPELARRMKRVTLVRSMHHDAAPTHETGQQLLMTGRLNRSDDEAPHVGSIVAQVLGRSGAAPAFAVVPGSMPFGHACSEASNLVQAGSKLVVVNMDQGGVDAPNWDCHGTRGFATLDDYARDLLPRFDRAYAALLDDLDRRGLLDSTLVVASGEFGRTPRINAEAGRDHWPGVWTALLAGGGIDGGRTIGASNRQGAEPADRPIRPEQLLATIYAHLGIPPAGQVNACPIVV